MENLVLEWIRRSDIFKTITHFETDGSTETVNNWVEFILKPALEDVKKGLTTVQAEIKKVKAKKQKEKEN